MGAFKENWGLSDLQMNMLCCHFQRFFNEKKKTMKGNLGRGPITPSMGGGRKNLVEFLALSNGWGWVVDKRLKTHL